jgi:UDP-N-acetylglucosamine:LPS N-acetylglucosamine transferase
MERILFRKSALERNGCASRGTERPLIQAKPKIMIVTSATGGGHISLAYSLQELFAQDYETHIVDPHPHFVHQYYTWAGRHSLKFWGASYKYSDNEKSALRLHHVLTQLVRKQLRICIERVQPQLIVTTHTLISYEIAQVCRRLGQNIPLVFQLSELECVHSTWLTFKNASAYLAPTREILAQARTRGIAENRLHLSGFPVRQQFLRDYTERRADLLASFGLDPAAFTIFLQGGAEGAAGLQRTVKAMLAAQGAGRAVQILLAVGTNKPLAQRFSGISHVKIVPFTREIAPYMAAADIISGKAGPNFLTEAVMLGKPFLATGFIPGQEQPNLAFLRRHNLGWVCLERPAQQALVARLVSDPSHMAETLASVQAYRAWNGQANRQIRAVIESLLSLPVQ